MRCKHIIFDVRFNVPRWVIFSCFCRLFITPHLVHTNKFPYISVLRYTHSLQMRAVAIRSVR